MALGALVWCSPLGWSDPPASRVQLNGWNFRLPLAFSAPSKSGLVTQALYFPPGSGKDNCACHIEVYFLRDQDMKDFKNDRSLATRAAEYGLGLALYDKPQKNLAVAFSSGPGSRRVFVDQMLRPRRVDMLLPPTGDGSFLSIGVESYSIFSEAQRQLVIDGIVKSLRK